jgi:RHS repeat-associated protein
LATAFEPGHVTGNGFVSRFEMPYERFAGISDKAAKPMKCENGDPVYTYDNLDRVVTMTTPVGTTTYGYNDTTGRLETITSPEGKIFRYSYNRGQIKSLEYPNGIMANYTFDDNGNLTDLDYKKNGSTLRSYGYTYDENGMRMSMTDVDGTHNYMYDTLYQIIQATHPTVHNPLEQFTYDTAGNRLIDLTHTNYQYNELNQLTEDDSCTYAYDADGNMTEKVSKSTGDTTHFVWDIENRLLEVRKPGTIARYSYDALGRRMNKEVNGVAKQFRYDGQNLILEMNANDSILANYTFGLGVDDPRMMNRTSKKYYYTKDGLGSVSALTDSTGSIVHEYKYSVFGEIAEETRDSVENPFSFTAREMDKETGLMYYRARYYDPQLGRFLSEDPIGFAGGQMNLYGYVLNSPVSIVDPLGLLPPDWLNAEDRQSVQNTVNVVTNNTFTQQQLDALTNSLVEKTANFEGTDIKGLKKLPAAVSETTDALSLIKLKPETDPTGKVTVTITPEQNKFIDKILSRIISSKDPKKELTDPEKKLIELVKKAITTKAKAIKEGVCIIKQK